MTADLADLERLMVLCRKQGVTSLERDGLRIVFGPTPDEAPKNGPKAVTKDDEMCRCGHPLHMHTNGLCTAACDAVRCLGEVKPE